MMFCVLQLFYFPFKLVDDVLCIAAALFLIKLVDDVLCIDVVLFLIKLVDVLCVTTVCIEELLFVIKLLRFSRITESDDNIILI
jgi:hypothetical protein